MVIDEWSVMNLMENDLSFHFTPTLILIKKIGFKIAH